MSALLLEILPSTCVDYCISCCLRENDENFLLIISNSVLRLYEIKKLGENCK